MQLLVRNVWLFRSLVFMTNWLQWYLMAPLQHSMAQRNRPYKLSRWMMPFRMWYWVVMYIYTTPLRLLNAFYFDMALYWSITLRDGIGDVFFPKLGRYRYLRGLKYLGCWTI